jgi:glucose/arabinose dehydrogenase
MIRTLAPLALLAAALLAAPPAGALGTELLVFGLDRPVFAAAPPGDARLFVVEQPGRVRIVTSDGTVLPAPFLDLRPGVLLSPDAEDERGMLGLAFAPDYATSGHLYVYYVAPPEPGVITIARVTRSAADPNLADAATLRLLFTTTKPQTAPGGGPEAYHNGGTLAFGPDGLLYAGIGDGGGWFGDDPRNCAQNASSPLGKLLRIDTANPPQTPVQATGNPCPTLPAQAAVAIWARGLRNPFRFAFDRETGDLYIGDVGQSAREEVDVVAAAALAGAGPNFGWRDFEGSICNPNLSPQPLCANPASHRPPIYEYAHAIGDFCSGSITGGVVYRGAIAELRGHYLFADYCQQFLRSLRWDGAGGIVPGSLVDRTPELDPLHMLAAVVAFAEDGAGEVVLVDRGFMPADPFFPGDGQLLRLVPEPAATAAGAAALLALAALARRPPG